MSSTPLLTFLESGVDSHTKRDRTWLRPVVEVLAANGIECPEDMVKLNVRAATFVLKDLVEGKVAFLERAVDKATQAAAQQATAESAAAGSSDSVSAFLQALQGGRKPVAHVNIAAGLGRVSLADLPASCWPSPQLTDWVQSQVKAAEGRGIQKPFLYLPIKKFLPHYATDKRQPSASEECVEERSFAEEIARGICQARDPDRKQGDLPSILQWCVAFDRWAIVAELTGQMAYAASMAHKEVVMQLALSARSNQRTAAIAVLYDELARRQWADLAAGQDGFDAAKAALSQDSSIMLKTEREYLARGLPVLQDSALSQPKGKGKGVARDHKGGSDYHAKSARAKGHGKGDKGCGKEHKGYWSGSAASGSAASGSQAPSTPPYKRQKTGP